MARLQLGIVLLFSLPMGLMTRDVKTPYGKKMCQQFCKIADCSPHFMPKDLSCHVVFNKSSLRSRRYELKWREEEKLIKSSLITYQLTPVLSASQTKPTPGTISLPSTTSFMSASVFPSVSVLYAHRKQVYKVTVIPETKECLPNVSRSLEGDVRAIVYSRTFKYIIAGTTRPAKILAFTENDLNNEPETLISMYFLTCMTIDNNINTLFIGRKRQIQKYDLKDRVKNGLIGPTDMHSLTLNTEKQIIYFACNDGVFSLQYIKSEESKRRVCVLCEVH